MIKCRRSLRSVILKKEGVFIMAKIKGRVHYVSPKGAAEMVAEVIAREVGCPKEALLPA